MKTAADFPGGAERRHRRGGPHGHRGHGGHGMGGRGRGFGRPGGWQQADLPPTDEAASWFADRLPSDWFVDAPDVTVDREEIIVAGELPPEEGEAPDEAAAQGRIQRFREDTRETRMTIADEAESRYGSKVAW